MPHGFGMVTIRLEIRVAILSILIILVPKVLSCVVAKLVMLAQEILAVVVAIGRTDNNVDVIFVGLGMLPKGDAALVVELDDDHWALHTVVKGGVVGHAAHPTKIGIAQMIFYFLHFGIGMPAPHAADVIIDKVQ